MKVDNYFSPSFGNRPSYLVGRDDVVNEFVSSLKEPPGSRGRSMLFLGQRGMGKTVLLWEFADKAREMGFVVANPTVVSDSLLERIVEKVQEDGERVLKTKHGSLSGGSVGALGFSVGLQFSREVQETKSPQHKLTQLARLLSSKGKGLLILVDEVQANSASLRQLIIQYQELMGERLDVAIAMAGLPTSVSAVLNNKVLTFLNRAKKVTLDPLKISDVDAYFKKAFEECSVAITQEQQKFAAEKTNGWPYLMQLIGHNIVKCAEQDISNSTLHHAISMAQDDFMNDVCKTTIAALSEKDVEFLKAMGGETVSKISDIANRLNVSTDYAQKYRKRLINAGIIEPASRGLVKISVPLLAEYLKKDDQIQKHSACHSSIKTKGVLSFVTTD